MCLGHPQLAGIAQVDGLGARRTGFGIHQRQHGGQDGRFIGHGQRGARPGHGTSGRGHGATQARSVFGRRLQQTRRRQIVAGDPALIGFAATTVARLQQEGDRPGQAVIVARNARRGAARHQRPGGRHAAEIDRGTQPGSAQPRLHGRQIGGARQLGHRRRHPRMGCVQNGLVGRIQPPEPLQGARRPVFMRVDHHIGRQQGHGRLHTAAFRQGRQKMIAGFRSKSRPVRRG